jgi:ribose transport system substrate-binding protein
MRKSLLRCAVVIVCFSMLAMFSLVSCKPAAQVSETSPETAAKAETTKETAAETEMKEPYKIALSNSFMGNDWRQEMQWVTELVAQKSPFKEKVTLRIVNVENTPEAQSDSIDVLVQEGYDAILVDASSPTALNPAIERATKAGVVIVSFDQVVTAESAWKIETDFNKIPNIQANYLVKAINAKGNMVMDRGLPGAPISKLLYDGAREVFDQYPDIKIVAEYDGQYAQGPSEQGMNAALAANPEIDAVYTQGYTSPIIKAIKAANRPLVPMSGFLYNGDLLALVDDNVVGIVANNIPGLGAMALKTAVDIIEGGNPPNHIVVDPTFAATDTSIDVGVPVEKIEIGKTCWREYPFGFDWPVLLSDFPAQVTPEEVAQYVGKYTK